MNATSKAPAPASAPAPIKYSDLLDSFRKLEWQQFEDFLFDLLRSMGRFVDIRRGSSFRGMQVDFVASEKNELLSRPAKWIFEARARSERVTRDDVDRFAFTFRALKDNENLSHAVLACTTPLSAYARHSAETYGIEVWDPSRLVQIAPSALLHQYLGLTVAGAVTLDKAVHEKSAALAQSFTDIQAGTETWPAYQRLVAETMQFLFCPPLDAPLEESPDADARNRRDMILENGAPDGFWSRLRTIYEAHYVVVDAKNYSSPLKKASVLDVAHYLKPHGCGMFGIIFSRLGAGAAALHAVREQWIASRKMILVLSDLDVKEMLRLKAEAGDPEELLRHKIADFRMSL